MHDPHGFSRLFSPQKSVSGQKQWINNSQNCSSSFSWQKKQKLNSIILFSCGLITIVMDGFTKQLYIEFYLEYDWEILHKLKRRKRIEERNENVQSRDQIDFKLSTNSQQFPGLNLALPEDVHFYPLKRIRKTSHKMCNWTQYIWYSLQR